MSIPGHRFRFVTLIIALGASAFFQQAHAEYCDDAMLPQGWFRAGADGYYELTVGERPGEPPNLYFSAISRAAVGAELHASALADTSIPEDVRTQVAERARSRATNPRQEQYAALFLSKHHVLGQQWMQLLYLAMCADDLIRRSSARPTNPSLMLAMWNIAAPPRPHDTMEQHEQTLFQRFVWSPANLFEGVHSGLRTDDPGAEIELNRPRTMDPDTWDILVGLSTTMQGFATRKPGTSRTFVFDISAFRARRPALLQALRKLHGINRMTTFTASDWTTTDMDERLFTGLIVTMMKNGALTVDHTRRNTRRRIHLADVDY